MARAATAAMVLMAAAAALWAAAPADEEPFADEPAVTSQPADAPASAPADPDAALAAARRLVEQSDRYLHHSRLHAGMTGYGLTVLKGTAPARFDVEILAVMDRWAAHQDVILARLGGPDMDRLGVSSGMSGSPIYVRDERDGRDKLIGAVAYAFNASKEPICGIQPITQMLTVRAAAEAAPAAAPAGAGDRAGRRLMAAALDPHRADLLEELLAVRGLGGGRQAVAGLSPLATPLMVAGLSDSTLRRFRPHLEQAGLLPVQAGSAGAGQALDAPFQPGSSLNVALVTGDVDISAVGAVTEVDGDRLLAFGHALFAEGEAEFPVGPATVHTVVPSLTMSFKLSSGGGVTGALVRDEYVGVAAVVGRQARMIPMNVTVDFSGHRRQFHYQVAHHRTLTAVLTLLAFIESATDWRELPELHTVRHRVDIDFGDLGRYHTTDVSCGMDISPAASDLTRPLVALMNNPLGPPAAVRSIDVEVSVEPADRSAEILDLKLDGSVYRPGEKLTGTVTLRPFRKARLSQPVSFELPADLPDGRYRLVACDADYALDSDMTEMPQRFDPRTVAELFAALKRLTTYSGDRLVLRLPRDEEHLAVGAGELDDLPASRMDILSEAAPPADAATFTRANVVSIPCKYVLVGRAAAVFEVQREPVAIPTRQ